MAAMKIYSLARSGKFLEFMVNVSVRLCIVMSSKCDQNNYFLLCTMNKFIIFFFGRPSVLGCNSPTSSLFICSGTHVNGQRRWKICVRER